MDLNNVEPSKLPGMKFDKFRADWSLIPMSIIEGVVWIYSYGAFKYDRNNWQKVENARHSYYAALQRHLNAWWNDGDYENGQAWDPEMGSHHLLHVIWNAIALSWFEMQRHGRDRWYKFIENAPEIAAKLRESRDAKLAKGEHR